MSAATKLLDTLPAAGAAINSTPSRQQAPPMSAHDSSLSLDSDSEYNKPSPRLLDRDPSKFRSLKRVIVIGRPGSGTDGTSLS